MSEVISTATLDKVQRALKDPLIIAARQLTDHPSAATIKQFNLALEEYQNKDLATAYALALLKEIRDLQQAAVPNAYVFSHSKTNLADNGSDSADMTPGDGTWDWQVGYSAHVFRVGIAVYTAGGGSIFNHTSDAVELLYLETVSGDDKWRHVIREEPYYDSGGTRWEVYFSKDIWPPVRFEGDPETDQGIRSSIVNYSGGTLSFTFDWHYFTVVERW